MSRTTDLGRDPEWVINFFEQRGLGRKAVFVVALRDEDCVHVARLRTSTRHLGLSLGDRACLALGQTLKVPVYTADRRWIEVNAPNLSVTLIRK